LAIPGADVLSMVPTVLNLQMIITKGGGWTLGLTVTDSAGAAVSLTGTTATLTFTDGTVWTATTTGNLYSWDITKASVDAISFQSSEATLAVSDGVHITVWAKGKVSVQ
jgi:hypothetical protein